MSVKVATSSANAHGIRPRNHTIVEPAPVISQEVPNPRGMSFIESQSSTYEPTKVDPWRSSEWHFWLVRSVAKKHRWSRGRHDDTMDLCLGALYPCPDTVREILAPTPHRTKRVLDIGW
jgi:hypothetical protein